LTNHPRDDAPDAPAAQNLASESAPQWETSGNCHMYGMPLSCAKSRPAGAFAITVDCRPKRNVCTRKPWPIIRATMPLRSSRPESGVRERPKGNLRQVPHVRYAGVSREEQGSGALGITVDCRSKRNLCTHSQGSTSSLFSPCGPCSPLCFCLLSEHLSAESCGLAHFRISGSLTPHAAFDSFLL
jgi:hypothetical protein